ncbi:hypothetical protein DRE_02891 [Drechslerella stenobrocha 248]|uniref:lytic cellulose monooxygenase (C4-dehydrogenating) n=1 Tax=Drechslerella stenobrocha 248 TaxID=1043628 RepID=W7HU39_9PEZI|nr:hypothetical protein DRE_02891 [Drechslerella stenobrocha 248]
MKAFLISLLSAASAVMAHGNVKELIIDGQSYPGYLWETDGATRSPPARIMQSLPNPFGDSPIIYLDNNDVVCNRGAKPAQLIARARAGARVTFKWDKWFDDHKGPVITYLANCGGDCRTANGADLDWFKIDEAGLGSDGVWATDRLMAAGLTWNLTLPRMIPDGQYLMRHEMIALHVATQLNGAQFYPSCSNIEITGGTGQNRPPTVKFPQAYSPRDPGILVNFDTKSRVSSYRIPGPPLYTEGNTGSRNEGSNSPNTGYPTGPSRGNRNNQPSRGSASTSNGSSCGSAPSPRPNRPSQYRRSLQDCIRRAKRNGKQARNCKRFEMTEEEEEEEV